MCSMCSKSDNKSRNETTDIDFINIKSYTKTLMFLVIHSCVQQEVIQIIREEGKKRKIILMWRAVVPVSLPTTHLPLGQFKPPSNLRFLFLNVDSRRETMSPSFTQYLELISKLSSE